MQKNGLTENIKKTNMAKKKVKEEAVVEQPVVVEKAEVQPVAQQNTDGNTSRDYRSKK